MTERVKDIVSEVCIGYSISWAKDPVNNTTDICIENIDSSSERYRIHIPYMVKDAVVEDTARAFISAFNESFRAHISRPGLE